MSKLQLEILKNYDLVQSFLHLVVEYADLNRDYDAEGFAVKYSDKGRLPLDVTYPQKFLKVKNTDIEAIAGSDFTYDPDWTTWDISRGIRIVLNNQPDTFYFLPLLDDLLFNFYLWEQIKEDLWTGKIVVDV